MGRPQIDMFASRLNYKVCTCVLKTWSSGMCCECFNFKLGKIWSNLLFPSICLLERGGQKIQTSQTTALMIVPQWNTPIDRAPNPDTTTETDWYLRCTQFTPSFVFVSVLCQENNPREGHQQTCIRDNSGFMEKRNQKTVLHLHLPMGIILWKNITLVLQNPVCHKFLMFLPLSHLWFGYSAVARFLGSWLDCLRLLDMEDKIDTKHL